MNTKLGDYIFKIEFELSLNPERFGSFFDSKIQKEINKLRNYGLAIDFAMRTFQGERYVTSQRLFG